MIHVEATGYGYIGEWRTDAGEGERRLRRSTVMRGNENVGMDVAALSSQTQSYKSGFAARKLALADYTAGSSLEGVTWVWI